jgi:hypothetical protein
VVTVLCGVLCGQNAEWCELSVHTVLSDASSIWSKC